MSAVADRLRALADKEWEPGQDRHARWCGMQGAHSLGAGQRGSCTCGMDALIQQRNELALVCADALDALAEIERMAGAAGTGETPAQPLAQRARESLASAARLFPEDAS